MSSDKRRGSKVSLIGSLYAQVAAVLGAFSMLVFASHFFDIGLNGFVRESFYWWVVNVRPLVGSPLNWLVYTLLPQGWRFEIQEPVKDYLGVGIISALSQYRADGSSYWTAGLRADVFLEVVSLAVVALVAWPYVILWAIGSVIWDLVGVIWPAGHRTKYSLGLHDGGLRYLAPLVYLAVILLANSSLR